MSIPITKHAYSAASHLVMSNQEELVEEKRNDQPVNIKGYRHFEVQVTLVFRNNEKQKDKAETCTRRSRQFAHSQVCPNYATQQALCSDP